MMGFFCSLCILWQSFTLLHVKQFFSHCSIISYLSILLWWTFGCLQFWDINNNVLSDDIKMTEEEFSIILLPKNIGFDIHLWMRVHLWKPGYSAEKYQHTVGAKILRLGHIEEGKRNNFTLPASSLLQCDIAHFQETFSVFDFSCWAKWESGSGCLISQNAAKEAHFFSVPFRIQRWAVWLRDREGLEE